MTNKNIRALQHQLYRFQPASLSSLVMLSDTMPNDRLYRQKLELGFMAIQDDTGRLVECNNWNVVAGINKKPTPEQQLLFWSMEEQQCLDAMAGISHDIVKSELFSNPKAFNKIRSEYSGIVPFSCTDDNKDLYVPHLLTTRQIHFPAEFSSTNSGEKSLWNMQDYLRKNISDLYYEPAVMKDEGQEYWDVFNSGLAYDRDNSLIYPAQFVAFYRPGAIDIETRDIYSPEYIHNQFKQPDQQCVAVDDKQQQAGRYYSVQNGWRIYMLEPYRMVQFAYTGSLAYTCEFLHYLEREFIDNYYSMIDPTLQWAEQCTYEILGGDPTHYKKFMESSKVIGYHDEEEESGNIYELSKAHVIDNICPFITPS